jgi:hypothetical protein
MSVSQPLVLGPKVSAARVVEDFPLSLSLSVAGGPSYLLNFGLTAVWGSLLKFADALPAMQSSRLMLVAASTVD